MITEDYVSFETAKLLKEKGFDGQCLSKYNSNGCIWDNIRYDGMLLGNNDIFPQEYLAPTLQMATKWLREKYGLFINLYPEFGDVEIVWNPGDFEEDMIGYKITIIDLNYGELKYKTLIEHNYEEACEAAIKYCLENLI